MWTFPTVNDFKAKFVRDFNYAPDTDAANLAYITDPDIQNALNEAEANFNTTLAYPNDAARSQSALYLAAFYLVYSLQNSAQGLGSQSNFPVNSKSVAGLSIAFQVPAEYMKQSSIAIYTMNGYGMMYLSYTLNLIRGMVHTVLGTTTVN